MAQQGVACGLGVGRGKGLGAWGCLARLAERLRAYGVWMQGVAAWLFVGMVWLLWQLRAMLMEGCTVGVRKYQQSAPPPAR